MMMTGIVLKIILKCYKHCIYPLNGSHEWHKTGISPPLPLIYSRVPGRPKKLRTVSEVEILDTKDKAKRVSKEGHQMKCTVCKEKCHNRRYCRLTRDSEMAGPQNFEIKNVVNLSSTQQEDKNNERNCNTREFLGLLK